MEIKLDTMKDTVAGMLRMKAYGEVLSNLTNEEFDIELNRAIDRKLEVTHDEPETVRKGQLWYFEECIKVSEMSKDELREYARKSAENKQIKEEIESADSVDELLDLL